MTLIGKGIKRLDGPAKVCGRARYTAEITLPRMAHAVLVQSTIAAGSVRDLNDAEVKRMPGVLLVLSHKNAQKLPRSGRAGVDPPDGRVLSLFQDARVHYNGQPLALVVAETLEQAQAAAAALKPLYSAGVAQLEFDDAAKDAHSPGKILNEDADTRRGDVDAGMAAARHRVQARYVTPMQNHNPMEPHATLAQWQGEQLTLWDSTQYVAGVRRMVSKTLGIDSGRVRVRNLFVGGAFGGKGSAWSHVLLAAMAARQCGRPVRLVLQRPQLFGPVGGRPRTQQTVELGADPAGRLQAGRHEVYSTTSMMEDWTESSAVVTRMLYACPNLETRHRLVQLNVGTPTFQRAPGEATGSFALESALDELALQSGLDPIALRLASFAERDPQKNLPFSSNALRECYRLGAEHFGWSERPRQPGSLRQGHWLVGMGMAACTRPAKRMPAAASVELLPDGSAVVRSSTEDLGTGTYTVMTQIAADKLGYPLSRVRFELGDTNFPEAPISAGSMTVESVGSAVHAACNEARRQLLALAVGDALSPLQGSRIEDLRVEEGWLRHADGKRAEPAAAVVARSRNARLHAQGNSQAGEETKRFSMHSFGAVFVKVLVDPELGLVRVPRVVAAYGVGQVINEKTARSQLMGGIVWGLSLALMEAALLDTRNGRIVNANLAEYHVPTNADIGDIEILIVPEQDGVVNSLGAKGLGEVSMTGVAAAVAMPSPMPPESAYANCRLRRIACWIRLKRSRRQPRQGLWPLHSAKLAANCNAATTAPNALRLPASSGTRNT